MQEMQTRWESIERSFAARGFSPPDRFQPPVGDEPWNRLQSTTGLDLPAEVEAFYRIHNGQRTGIPGVIFGIELLSAERMIENWQSWQEVANDGLNEDLADSMSSDPPEAIKPLYLNLRWLPLTHDQGGNHIGLDFDPGPQGTSGQVIIFGRDEDEKKLVAKTFGQFIDLWIQELETVDWSLDAASGWQINDASREAVHYHEWPRGPGLPGD